MTGRELKAMPSAIMADVITEAEQPQQFGPQKWDVENGAPDTPPALLRNEPYEPVVIWPHGKPEGYPDAPPEDGIMPLSTHVIYNYGDYAGPGPSYFQAWIGLQVDSANGDGSLNMSTGSALWCVDGSDFEGTICNIEAFDQGNHTVQFWGMGWYSDSSWWGMGLAPGQSYGPWCRGWYTSGSGRYNESSISRSWTNTFNWWDGNRITASKTEVRKNETVTIGYTGSKDGIAAQLWSYEVWLTQANGGVADQSKWQTIWTSQSQETTTNKSWTFTPSDYLQEGYEQVVFVVREYHEWYGAYPYTSSDGRVVTVKSDPEVTAYDSAGNACTGIVYGYDADGNACEIELYAYDSAGKLCDV